jgi:2-keto-4-pentenoate hydratase/2-oxohepta-3-ene-1,7-dioic acid hydratase in catechol pathway
MRYVSFLLEGIVRSGIVRDDAIHPLPRSAGRGMVDYIALPRSQRESIETETPVPLAHATLLAPLRPRKNVVCVGRNYLGHAEEIARARNVPLNLPKVPTFFTKATTAIADPDAILHFDPTISPEYDWEAELAVIIGERCKDVSAADALDVVFGYTCFNDLTARDVQKDHGQWFKGKSLDDSAPIGPWIVDAAEIGDPHALDISLTVNGVTKQSSNTSQLIFKVPQIIESLSRGMTLEPGDIIATGTPDGVGLGRTPPEFLKDGDVVEVTIAKIGSLRNTIAMAAAPALAAT